MVRKYADPVQVRRGTQCEEGCAPETFLWRGRLYVVRAVLGHWWERQAWWTATPARSVHGWVPEGEGVPGEAPEEPREGAAPNGAGRAEWGSDREVWRVEASPGRAFGTGVYDLGCPGDDAWLLLRVAD